MASPNAPHPWAGHVGQLSPAQAAALDEFKQLLGASALYIPSTDGSPASHDDPTLLYVGGGAESTTAVLLTNAYYRRFLRARAFQPASAQRQFADTEAWRTKHAVDSLYAGFDHDEFESAKRFYPRWTGRRDKQGLPLSVYRLISLDPIQKELDAVPAERRLQRLIVLYEVMIRFYMPLCSHLPRPYQDIPVSSTTSIIDLQDVSFTAMWRFRGLLQEASKLATANYPETLHTIAIVNAPSFFPTIWGWIKGWFDEGTRNKIHILGKDPGPSLREIIDVKDLPKMYGGDLEWKFGDEPLLDDDAIQVLGKDAPTGPIIFSNGIATKP